MEVEATELRNSVCSNGECGDCHSCWVRPCLGGVSGTCSCATGLVAFPLVLREDARRTRVSRGDACSTWASGDGALCSMAEDPRLCELSAQDPRGERWETVWSRREHGERVRDGREIISVAAVQRTLPSCRQAQVLCGPKLGWRRG